MGDNRQRAKWQNSCCVLSYFSWHSQSSGTINYGLSGAWMCLYGDIAPTLIMIYYNRAIGHWSCFGDVCEFRHNRPQIILKYVLTIIYLVHNSLHSLNPISPTLLRLKRLDSLGPVCIMFIRKIDYLYTYLTKGSGRRFFFSFLSHLMPVLKVYHSSQESHKRRRR